MQVKDLIVTGDARILGDLYVEQIENAPEVEYWTFTLEDGTVITKAVLLSK